MDNLVNRVRVSLPKVVTARYGIRVWIREYKQDKLPTNLRQEIARVCYTSDIPQDVFYDKVFTYKQFDNTKYKLV